MTITSIAGFLGPITTSPRKSASDAAPISTSKPSNTSAYTGPVPALGIKAQVRTLPAALPRLKATLTHVASTSQVATNTLSRQADIIRQLKQLALQATNTSNSNSINQLNSQFQTLVQQLQEMGGTQFAGKSLFDGNFTQSLDQSGQTLTGTASLGQTEFTFPSLTTTSLFGNTQPDISTPANAQAALPVLHTADQYVSHAQSDVSAFVEIIHNTSTDVEVALNNYAASNSDIATTPVLFPAADKTPAKSAYGLTHNSQLLSHALGLINS